MEEELATLRHQHANMMLVNPAFALATVDSQIAQLRVKLAKLIQAPKSSHLALEAKNVTR